MAQTNMTVDEMINSVTGFEDIAVTKAFGTDVLTLRERPMTCLRALVFVANKREGMKDAEAYNAALGLTMAEVDDAFEDAVSEIDPENPDTEQGKE